MGNCCCYASNPCDTVEEKSGLLPAKKPQVASDLQTGVVKSPKHDVDIKASKSVDETEGGDSKEEEVTVVEVKQDVSPKKPLADQTSKSSENVPAHSEGSPSEACPASADDNHLQTGPVSTTTDRGDKDAAIEQSNPPEEVSIKEQTVTLNNNILDVVIQPQVEEKRPGIPSPRKAEMPPEQAAPPTMDASSDYDSGKVVHMAGDAHSEESTHGNEEDSQVEDPVAVPDASQERCVVADQEEKNCVQSVSTENISQPFSSAHVSPIRAVKASDSVNGGVVEHTEDYPGDMCHVSPLTSAGAKQNGLTENTTVLVEEEAPLMLSDVSPESPPPCQEEKVEVVGELLGLNEVSSLEEPLEDRQEQVVLERREAEEEEPEKKEDEKEVEEEEDKKTPEVKEDEKEVEVTEKVVVEEAEEETSGADEKEVKESIPLEAALEGERREETGQEGERREETGQEGERRVESGQEGEEEQEPCTSTDVELEMLPVTDPELYAVEGLGDSEEDLYRGEEEISTRTDKPTRQEITLAEVEERCSLAAPVDIQTYGDREWKGNTAKSALIRKGYAELSHRFGWLRQVRGDNYCALRATLFQVLSLSTQLPVWMQDVDISTLPQELQDQGVLIGQWMFPAACRTGEGPEDAVHQLKRYMELLQTKWQAAVDSSSPEERQRLCERVFQGGEEELGLLEALKLLMLARATELHATMQEGGDVPLFCWLLFARDSSACPRTFLSNHLSQVGFSGGLEQVEMFLLGHALQCTIQAYRLYMADTEEFVTYYPDDHKEDWPCVCLVTEDDRHYNVPVGETV